MLKDCKSLPPGKKLKISHTPILNETLVPGVGLHPVAFSGNMTDHMPQREVITEPTALQSENDGH
jgi:hypothetical protein